MTRAILVLALLASTAAAETTPAPVVSTPHYVLDFSLGGTAIGGVVLPSGLSVGGNVGGGILLDLAFGVPGAPVDHFHVDLSASIQSLTANAKSSPAITIALVPAYQIDATSPLLGVGPMLSCPTAHLAGFRNWCAFGIAFTSGFAKLLKTVGVGN